MERAGLAFLISATAVLFGIAPLLRAGVPGWQIGAFAIASAAFVAAIVWRMTAPQPKPPQGAGRPLYSHEIRDIVTRALKE